MPPHHPTTASPPVAATVADLRARVSAWRADGETCALVPTMGALHEGHLSLVDVARQQAHRTIVSIFVNPTQFAAHEDLATYPRDQTGDLAKLAARGVDLVFMPEVGEMYPDGFATTVTVAGVSDGLCGASRPHFFAGVATVVAKLLLQAGADLAVFGEKDYQQLLVVRRMARDLDIPTRILGAPIVRESDGLAMSSRNAYLSDSQRKIAGQFNAILRAVADGVRAGRPTGEVLAESRRGLLAAGVDEVDYLEIRDAETLAPVGETPGRPARVFGAIVIGGTRLIDNLPIEPAGNAD